MVDFGTNHPDTRPLYDLLNKKLRPGDIYTHMYSGLRNEQDPVTMGPSKAFIDGRKRGIYFDTGTGGGSFKWSLAVPMVKDGFIPDSISTDLHIGSMNGATKDELNVASKMMAIGLSLKEAVAEMTSHPAREIKHEELGNLSEGSIADVAVLRLEKGHYGFTDMQNTRVDGQKSSSTNSPSKTARSSTTSTEWKRCPGMRLSTRTRSTPRVGRPLRRASRIPATRRRHHTKSPGRADSARSRKGATSSHEPSPAGEMEA